MKRFVDFFDKVVSAINGSPEDGSAGRLTTQSEQPAARTRSQNTCGAGQPRDTIQILDISISMDCSDYRPTRLAGGIQAATEYISSRAAQSTEDRIAVVTFDTNARIVLPLTPVGEQKNIVAVIRRLKLGGGTDIAEGLQAAIRIFREEPRSDRLRQIILLTDGHGGNPISKAAELKERYGAVINVVGIGGTRESVEESLLRKVATTDPDGSNHYRFISDSATLKQHYQQLATGLVWRGRKP